MASPTCCPWKLDLGQASWYPYWSTSALQWQNPPLACPVIGIQKVLENCRAVVIVTLLSGCSSKVWEEWLEDRSKGGNGDGMGKEEQKTTVASRSNKLARYLLPSTSLFDLLLSSMFALSRLLWAWYKGWRLRPYNMTSTTVTNLTSKISGYPFFS